MIIRAKGGEYQAGSASVLLDFLGVKAGVSGRQRVAGDVELIASVPFLVKEQVTNNSANQSWREQRGEGEEHGIAWTLSTFDLDRFEERVDPSGWDIRQFLANPVVEWAHRYDIPAIGKIEGLYADDNGLHGAVFFNDKAYDPFGWGIGQRVKAGVIRAGSVGFRAIEIEIPSKEDSRDGTSLIFRKQELLEFSICNVPANPFALAKEVHAEAHHTFGMRRGEQVTGNREQIAINNEQLSMRNEKANIATIFWAGLINNYEGAGYGK